MRINVRALGWKDNCSGCSKEIKNTEKVYMISGVWGINGSIHLCDDCIDKIIKSKESKQEA